MAFLKTKGSSKEDVPGHRFSKSCLKTSDSKFKKSSYVRTGGT